MALVPWTLLSARASPSLCDVKEATKRREAHGGSPGHLPGEPGALICAERAHTTQRRVSTHREQPEGWRKEG